MVVPKMSAFSLKPAASRRGVNNGRMPVGRNSPGALVGSVDAVSSNLKISVRTIVSPSMPATSVMEVILREPSLKRDCCTIRSIAEEMYCRTFLIGQLRAGHQDHGFQAGRASRGVFACSVVSEPS